MADDANITGERQEKQPTRKKPTSLDCIDCGNRIPMARQAATGGTTKCAECKANEEHLGRHFR
jgi:RNA polymerase-binding transcription factor DksA